MGVKHCAKSTNRKYKPILTILHVLTACAFKVMKQT